MTEGERGVGGKEHYCGGRRHCLQCSVRPPPASNFMISFRQRGRKERGRGTLCD